MLKVLYLYGSGAGPFGRKYQALSRETDFEVKQPELPFPAWRPKNRLEWPRWGVEALASLPAAKKAAQIAADDFQPDVIVGSSMGGALAIGVEAAAARVLVAPAVEVKLNVEWPNPLVDRRLDALSIIFHAENDELVPFEASVRLLEEAARHADPGAAATMTLIQKDLEAAGYATRHGRLVRIGRDHSCNEPDPDDTWNRDPDPHRGMIAAVRILAGLRAAHRP